MRLERSGFDRAIQGNLESDAAAGAARPGIAATDEVLARAGGRPGHIFNLGPVSADDAALGTCRRLAR